MTTISFQILFIEVCASVLGMDALQEKSGSYS